jgi:Protein of unknown function (DUF3675)
MCLIWWLFWFQVLSCRYPNITIMVISCYVISAYFLMLGLFFSSGGWTITGTPLDLHDPRILAVAAAQRRLLEAEYDEYAATNASGAAFCRSAALIVSSLLFRTCKSFTNYK